MERHFFAGGNTPIGFYSYYDNIINSVGDGRLIILKGGPGVGKSSLIKKVGAAFTAKGKDIEYMHCSGDNDSYDGIYVPDENLAIIDGTAPHMIDPSLPGVRDEIVNLGVYIDTKEVKEHRSEIELSMSIKSRYYKNAYHLLAAAASLDAIEFNTIGSAVDVKGLNQEAFKFIDSCEGLAKNGRDRKLFCSAITPDGYEDFFETNFRNTKTIEIQSYSLCELAIFLEKVADKLVLLGYDIESYFNPMRPSERIAILLKDSDILLLGKASQAMPIAYKAVEEFENVIDLTKYVSLSKISEQIELINSNKPLVIRLIKKASQELKKAQMVHKNTESYFVMNMDWNNIALLTKKIISEIVGD